MHQPLCQPIFSTFSFNEGSQQWQISIGGNRATTINAASNYAFVTHNVSEMISPAPLSAIQHGGRRYGYDNSHDGYYSSSAAVDDSCNPSPANPCFSTRYMNPSRIGLSDPQYAMSEYSTQQVSDNRCHGPVVQPSDLHWQLTPSHHSEPDTRIHPNGASITSRPVSASVVYQSLAYPGKLVPTGKTAPRRTPMACRFCRKRKVGPKAKSRWRTSLTTWFR